MDEMGQSHESKLVFQNPNQDSTNFRKPIKSYVLRQTRMTNLQKKAYQELQHLIIPFTHQRIEPIKGYSKVVLEIGFGMGHATAKIAQSNPEVLYYAIEVHTPGVGALLARIQESRLDNIRIIQHDALEVLDAMISHQLLDGVHLFFPDPWPKKKHHKRRILQLGLIERILPTLKVGGYFYAVTDWEEYGLEMLDQVHRTTGLVNPYKGFADPQPWRPKTAFEHKGFAKNHKMYEVFAQKK